MKLLFLTNNKISIPLQQWLVLKGHIVVLEEKKIFYENIKSQEYDLIISYCYRYLITQDLIDEMDGNIINLHISYLPWNRGADPNYWSYFDNTPKGVTIHYINEKLDMGDIIAQSLVDLSQAQTYAQAYIMLHEEIQILFKTAFQQYCFWRRIAYPQKGVGSYHSKKDLIDRVGTGFDWNLKLP